MAQKRPNAASRYRRASGSRPPLDSPPPLPQAQVGGSVTPPPAGGRDLLAALEVAARRPSPASSGDADHDSTSDEESSHVTPVSSTPDKNGYVGIRNGNDSTGGIQSAHVAHAPCLSLETVAPCDEAVASAPSYGTSIEVMAALVDASRKQQIEGRSPRSNKVPALQPRHRQRSDRGRDGAASGSGGANSTASLDRGETPARNKVRSIAIAITVLFVTCEVALWILVYSFKDGRDLVPGEKMVASLATWISVVWPSDRVPRDGDSSDDGAAPLAPQAEVLEEMLEEAASDLGEEMEGDSVEAGQGKRGAFGVLPQKQQATIEVEVERKTPTEDGGAETRQTADADPSAERETPREETRAKAFPGTDTGSDGPVKEEAAETLRARADVGRLRAALDEGFALLTGAATRPDDAAAGRRAAVEALCGGALPEAHARLSARPLTLDGMRRRAEGPWKSLALDALRCLGGAGPTFLGPDGDGVARLGLSTRAFDRLSYIDPDDAEVRAGLGTSLLLRSLFRSEDGNLTSMRKEDSSPFLLAAAYHLEVSSSLHEMEGDADGAAVQDAGTSHSAVLHNLALAHVALGHHEAAVPVLLRAAALRPGGRRDAGAMAYWNAPWETLRAAERRALARGSARGEPQRAARKRPPARAGTDAGEPTRMKRIPFLGIELDAEETPAV